MSIKPPGGQRKQRAWSTQIEIVWSPLARARLQEIRAYVELDKPEAAERLATRIVAIVEALRNHPNLGRAGNEPGIRELVIGGTPYIVLYRIRGKRITISTVWHGAQRKNR
ncbi:MAG TPA: type II toxin-antitoxin system RelE/ParE family toxin [Terriglobales bacterium]|nr:type II toxin-antitoxin system RelE/ParE family toxin [Terriglobales bacterium]